MTVPSNTARSGPYDGNDIVTAFPYSFRILDETHIRVVITDALGVETDADPSTYSVSGVGDPDGEVTYPLVGSPLATGAKLTIVRDMPFTQLTDIANAGGFYPETHERVFDSLMMHVQQVQEQVDRSVKVGVSDESNPDDILDGLDAAAAAAAASAAAALVSENNADTSEAGAASSAAAAASSAAAAATSAAGMLWSDVVFLSFADSPYTVLSTQKGRMFAVDTSGGAVTINLPTIATVGTPFNVGFKKTSSDGNAVTINRGGTDTIDGATTKSLASPDAGATFIADTDTAPDRWTTLEFGARAGNMTLDSFTGNGVQTAYTLSVAPGSANNVAWYEGGVRQKPGTDYTLAGTTLTRTSAPGLGVAIFAVTGTTLSIGVPGDDTVETSKLRPQVVNGATTVTAVAADSVMIADASDSGNFKKALVSDIVALSAITAGTPVASTSGTAIDFTSIPAGVKRVTVNFAGVSLSGTDNLIVQIGDLGGVETSGYLGTCSVMAGASQATVDYTTGFGIRVDTAAVAVSGSVVLELVDPATNTWVSTQLLSADSGATYFGAGRKSLSAVLDRIRITTVLGANTFDAGTININYEA